MNEIILTAPTGEIFSLRDSGEYYIHQYDMAKGGIGEAGLRIRKWIPAEGWMEAFKPGWYPLTVEDFTDLPERI